ncbi:hypothetical protein SO802_028986 [Lithocarpus litseifolius]|uniref:Uncharacterized protein n=1 Tax=Lithocarpus litseifolius TaxID=425828 RepID=A0AAW2BU13_9ROSI
MDLGDSEEAGGPPPLPSPPPTIPLNVKPEQVATHKNTITGRHGVETTGQSIQLLSNHFKVDVSDASLFYQYSVSITAEENRVVEGRGIRRKVIENLFQKNAHKFAGKTFAYDGEKSLYTVSLLPLNLFESEVVLEEVSKSNTGSPGGSGSPSGPSKKSRPMFRSRNFNVNIIAKVPLTVSLAPSGDDDALRFLNTVLRQQAANRGCLLVRQSVHNNQWDNIDVGGGVKGVQGFHSSFCLTKGGLSLNMDVSTTMILKAEPVINFILASQDIKSPKCIDWVEAKRMLKNFMIKTTHQSIEYKIIGLSDSRCKDQLFDMRVKNGDGANKGQTVSITVYDYFRQHYNIQLQWSAYMPCVDVGKPERPKYLPLELCRLIPDQRYTKALSLMQRASLAKKSSLNPQARVRTLIDAVGNQKDDPVLAEFHISMEKKLTQVEGRILETPKLKFGNSEDCIPCNGRWNFNSKKLYEPCFRIERWVVVNFSTPCETFLFSQELINCGKDMGIIIDKPYRVIEEKSEFISAGPVKRVEEMFKQVREAITHVQIILCVLPKRKNSDIYGPWKKICLCDYGIVTQCASPSNINRQYLTNLLLKINSKLGGINSLLEIESLSCLPLLKETPTLILGMDVSHGSPGRSDIPSVAAVVGSRCWPPISRYRASVRAQPCRMEMIEALYKPLEDGNDYGIIRELLLDFYQMSNRKPTQIIVFRDGVSESQFDEVLNNELDQIRRAYQNLWKDIDPMFTVIVAQKNHHTKLFQAGSLDNVPPGGVQE